jgi:phosphoglycolate phosphatase
MSIDTFLFDLDGTLVDSVADLTTAINLLRGELELPPLPAAAVRTFVGDGATLLVRRALPEHLFNEERLHRFLALYEEHLLDRTSLYAGIPEFLELHREKKLAVVTNKPYRLTVKLLAGLGLSPRIHAVIGGDSAPEKKPHPAPVLSALEQLGAEPATALLIGDHHTDLRAGLGAGVRTCFCAWGIGNDGGTPYDFLAETPYDLPRLFPGEDR